MARILPTRITHPLRNKVCLFPTEDDCEMTSSEINSIIRRNPYSFNNIFHKNYIKRLTGIKKYNAIRRQFAKFKKNNIIKVDENPGFYIYNIVDNEKNEYTGIVAKIPHSEFLNQTVVKVEKSDAEKVTENFELFQHTGFVSKPITVVHDSIDEIDEIIKRYKSKIPVYEFTRTTGYIHEVWQVLAPDDIAIIKSAYQQLTKLYILDDNNSFEALHRIYKNKMEMFQNTYTGLESFNFFPVLLLPSNQVKIYEYKKGVPPDYEKNLQEIIELLKHDFYFEQIYDYEEPEKGEILMYSLQGNYKLIPKQHIDASLPDTVIFEQYILPAISKKSEVLAMEALKYCSGDRSAKCVENQLNKGNCKYGFIIKPMNFQEIKSAVFNQVRIPYKSMYINPRVLKGLFIYEI